MDQVCLVVPVLPGRTADARDFMRELETGRNAAPMPAGHVKVEVSMMFLDCPAYLDQDGTRRCGLPAEVTSRFTMRSSGGPLEAATIKCPAGHWFNGPIESLTWDRNENRYRGQAGAAASATGHGGDGRDDSSLGTSAAGPLSARPGILARPHTGPAYYLGRPARMWITAMSPRRGRQPAAGTLHPAGHGQAPNPAHEPSRALA